ncbi:hypothetical protein [Janibacter terrae]|uniref:hypothetical protein n=1 Tax=Janibacter terrae TaxID=103817 RepID=UPI0031F920E5
MSVDEHAQDHALQVLLDALTVHVAPGGMFTWDTIRDATTAAQLRPGEIRAAIRHAIAGGWVEPVLLPLGARDVHACIPSVHPPARGRRLAVYRRTRRPSRAPRDAA